MTTIEQEIFKVQCSHKKKTKKKTTTQNALPIKNKTQNKTNKEHYNYHTMDDRTIIQSTTAGKVYSPETTFRFFQRSNDSSLVERRTRDRNVVSSHPGGSGGKKNSSPELTLCADSYSVSVPSFPLFQAEDGIRDVLMSRGLGDVYKRQTFIQSYNE